MPDILIVGAGPSGLLMASESIRQGLTCRIIDKSLQPSDKSKAIAVQARTLEVLNYHGLAEECIENGLKIEGFMPMSEGKKLFELNFDSIPSPYPFMLSLEQSKMEAILIRRLEKWGCKVERGVEMLSFEQTENGVKCLLKDNLTSSEETCQASWLIGCDGAHSIVRKQLSMPFEGKSYPQILSLADLELEWKYPREKGVVFLNTSGLMFVLPIEGNNRVRLIFQLERGEEFLKNNQHLGHGEIPSSMLKEPTVDEATQIIHAFADPKAILKNPVWMANFNINSRMVKSYHDNKVFLAGDAAHIHSPVGGQGMNTGLQDAFNLGWKIALVQKGIAKPSLLQSYNEERHFVGKTLLKGTEKATDFIMMRNPLFIFFRNFFIPFLTSFKAIKFKIITTISEVNIRYPLSPWTVQNSGKKLNLAPGIRAPDASMINEGKKTSLFNIWTNSTKFHLLIVDSKNRFSFLPDQSKELEKYKEILKVQTINDSQDNQGLIQTLYGDTTFYLIRPDGYIALCGQLPSIESVKNYLSKMMVA